MLITHTLETMMRKSEAFSATHVPAITSVSGQHYTLNRQIETLPNYYYFQPHLVVRYKLYK